MNLVLGCVTQKYANFSERARRKEYFLFVLVYVILNVVFVVIDVGTGTFNEAISMGALTGIFVLAMIVPGLAVSVRRLHDTNRSGWWLLIGFIPLVGSIWLLVLVCLRGTSGENRFGPDPLTTQ
jgi:uncharacterized membrane protein YhaH (DUF805 family)